MQEILDRFDKLDSRLDRIETRLDGIDARLDGIDARLDGIDARLDGMDARFDGMDARFDGMDARFDGMDARFDGMDTRFEKGDDRFDRIEAQLHKQGVLLESVSADLKQTMEVVIGNREVMDREFSNLRIQIDERVQPLESASRHLSKKLAAVKPARKRRV
jgi:archaellum component FlaC